MKKAYKKLAVVLLTVAAVAMVEARTKDNNDDSNNSRVYQPKSPWPFAPVEDATMGAVGVVTANHAGDASGLAVTAPDAIPGVSYARTKDRNNDQCNNRKYKKRHTAGQSNSDDMNYNR